MGLGISKELREEAKKALKRQKQDKRSEQEKIRDAVQFILDTSFGG